MNSIQQMIFINRFGNHRYINLMFYYRYFLILTFDLIAVFLLGCNSESHANFYQHKTKNIIESLRITLADDEKTLDLLKKITANRDYTLLQDIDVIKGMEDRPWMLKDSNNNPLTLTFSSKANTLVIIANGVNGEFEKGKGDDYCVEIP